MNINLSDKRPYGFIDRADGDLGPQLKRRTPDCTMGLRAFSQKHLGNEELAMGPSECYALSRERLRNMMELRECGLVVDPKWGETDLIFPWGVYEAKKKVDDHEQAQAQVFQAAPGIPRNAR